MVDFKALGAKAASLGANMTVAVAGGGDYEPPAAGPTRLRFVAYVELGKQKGSFQGKATIKDKVQLVFELSGKNHHPDTTNDGVKIPKRISIELNLSLSEKASFFKLFQRMNYKQTATHMAELLGESYKGEVFHREWTGRDGKKNVSAELDNDAGFSIAPPRVEDDDAEGGWKYLEVAAPITPIKCFIWSIADKEQWGSLFIDGEYPERKDASGKVTAPAKSKNILQNKIKRATNFVGSPMHELLVADGTPIDIPAMDEQDDDNPAVGAAATPTPAAVATGNVKPDALGGIV